LLYKNKLYFNEIIQSLQDLGYIVDYQLLNAVKFGVPQNRERLIVVGHKGKFHFPKILGKIVSACEALEELAFMAPPESKFLTPSMDEYVAKYEKASSCKRPRDLHLDKPARRLTCRNLAGATGDMHRIKLPDARRRRLLLREAARLQSFPDWFEFAGSETSCFNQIGNAVPPLFSYYLAGSIRDYLELSAKLSSNQIERYSSPIQISLPF
jgi:DNA (cytosine-5)-methyltransferase 1